jgi:hypothetical protein
MCACRQDRVFAVDGNAYLNRAGPRLIDSVEILAHLLHPQRANAPTWTVGRNQPWARLSQCAGRLIPA